MKRLAFVLMFATGLNAMAQEDLSDYDKIQNWRINDYRGMNVFEAPKNDVEYDGIKVRVGGDFAMQFQSINQSNLWNRDSNLANSAGVPELSNLGSNFNLPTANLNLDAQFADGLRMHLRTYLSSRHHPEAWVKGGYIQVDKLDFIQEGLASGLMEMLTIKVGLDEINYGDAHFRRSDNARAFFNPFVGNYLMDGFTTEAFGEILFRKAGIIALAGVSNGNLNQRTVVGDNENMPSPYFKLGYDDQITDDLRLRVTGSGYLSPGYDNGTWLYNGDRAGSRYYNVIGTVAEGSSNFGGRFNPRFRKYNSFMGSVFTKFKGLEFFGFYETVMGEAGEGIAAGAFNQMAAELIYRIGEKEKFYLAGRYNLVQGIRNEAYTTDIGGVQVNVPEADPQEIQRINFGGGWFLTKNIMTKVEYVDQRYIGSGWEGSQFQGADFSGIVVEAAISF